MEKIHTYAICAYKESEFLEECIKSVIEQRDYSEIILATSTPNTFIEELCMKYNIPMYVNTGEPGITQDWEFALSKVKTPVATVTHQDDIYFNDYSKTIVNEYRRRKKPLLFFSDYYEIRGDKYIKTNKLLRIKKIMLFPLRVKGFQKRKWVRRSILAFGSAICCPSVAYALDYLPRPLFFNHFRTNEDWEAWERFSKLDGEFVYISRPLMAHRIHADSETTAMIEGGGRSIEDYEMFCKFWPQAIARLLTRRYKSSEKSNTL